MNKKILLTLLIFSIISLVSAADTTPPEALNSYNNLTNNTFDSVNPVDFNITGEFRDNQTGLQHAFLETNETRTFKNRTGYGIYDFGNITGSKANASITWTNRNDIVSPRTVQYRVWANDSAGNWASTEYKTFKIVEDPVILSTKVNDVQANEVATVKVRAVDIVGRDDILNVTAKISSPKTSRYEEITLEKDGEINSSEGLEGYNFVGNYTRTDEVGVYQVDITARDESSKATDTGRFEVTGIPLSQIEGFRLNPFYLGSGTFSTGLTEVLTKKRTFLITGTLVLMLGVVVLLNRFGPEFQERDFEETTDTVQNL